MAKHWKYWYHFLLWSHRKLNPPSEFARPRESGPAWLLYQLGPARLHYCAVLLTVLERWVAPCLLLSLSAFCILGNNTLQTLEFSKHPYRKRVHLWRIRAFEFRVLVGFKCWMHHGEMVKMFMFTPADRSWTKNELCWVTISGLGAFAGGQRGHRHCHPLPEPGGQSSRPNSGGQVNIVMIRIMLCYVS